MSVFGSKSEDPLLQNDPFAPPSENDESKDEASEDEAPFPSGAPPEEEGSSGPAHEEAQSVFGPAAPSADGAESGAPPEEGRSARVLVRSFAEAAHGGLAAVNEALESGWDLERVRVNDVASAPPDADREAETPPSTLALAFVLRRTEEDE